MFRTRNNILKIVMLIMVGLFFTNIVIIGQIEKKSFTDVFKSEELDSEVMTGYIPEEYIDVVFGDLEEIVEEAPIIVKAKAQKSFEYYGREGRQLVLIEEVFRGNGLEQGDEIYVYSNKIKFIDSGIFYSIGMWNTSFMEVEGEYLIFLLGEVPLPNSKDKIYQLYDEKINIMPIFSYEDLDNGLVEVNDKYGCIQFSETKGREIFTNSKVVMSTYLDIKHQLLKKYSN